MSSGGTYIVSVWLPNGSADRPTNAPFTVHDVNGNTTYPVNEQAAGGQWVILGQHTFTAGTNAYVELSDQANGTNIVGDAVKFDLIQQDDLIMDNTAAMTTGTWTTTSLQAGYFGTNYTYARTDAAAATIRWTPNVPVAGTYGVYYWLPNGLSNRASNAPFTVYDANGDSTYPVNQQSTGGQWILLGDHTFTAGTSGYIQLSNSADQIFVIADAIKLVRR